MFHTKWLFDYSCSFAKQEASISAANLQVILRGRWGGKITLRGMERIKDKFPELASVEKGYSFKRRNRTWHSQRETKKAERKRRKLSLWLYMRIRKSCRDGTCSQPEKLTASFVVRERRQIFTEKRQTISWDVLCFLWDRGTENNFYLQRKIVDLTWAWRWRSVWFLLWFAFDLITNLIRKWRSSKGSFKIILHY